MIIKVLEKEEKEDGQRWTPYNANMSMQGIKVSEGRNGQCGPFYTDVKNSVQMRRKESTSVRFRETVNCFGFPAKKIGGECENVC